METPTIVVEGDAESSVELKTSSSKGKSIPFVSEIEKILRDGIAAASYTGSDGTTHQSSFRGNSAADTASSLLNINHEGAVRYLSELFDRGVITAVFTDTEKGFFDNPDYLYAFAGASPAEAASGVVMEVAPCYVSGCASGKLCYSPTCRRSSWRLSSGSFESNFLSTPSMMKRSGSISSVNSMDRLKKPKLWIQTYDASITSQVPDREKKRQEIIFETIYTEQEYYEDLTIVRQYFIDSINSRADIMEPQQRRTEFVQTVFNNWVDLISVNETLSTLLNERQAIAPVVERIGDIFLKVLSDFEAYVSYCPGQMTALFTLEKELKTNTALKTLLEERQRMPECRRLPLDSFLGRPRTRFGKYVTMLESVLKATDENSPDIPDLTEAINGFKSMLNRANAITGVRDNRLKLDILHDQLLGREEFPHLDLKDTNRHLHHAAFVKRRGNSDWSELRLFLLDHMLLMTIPKKAGLDDAFQVTKEPYRYEQLTILTDEEAEIWSTVIASNTSAAELARSSLTSAARAVTTFETLSRRLRGKTGGTLTGDTSPRKLTVNSLSGNSVVNVPGGSAGSFTFAVAAMSRKPYLHYFRATSLKEKETWVAVLSSHIQSTVEATSMFEYKQIGTAGFSADARVNCLTQATDASGRSIWVAGTNDGVFVKSSPTSEFLRVLPLERVAQVRVLQSQGTVIVLGGKSQELITYPLSLLDPATCGEAAGEAVTVPNSDGTSLFEHGVKGGKEYIALVKVKAEQGKTSLKLYEPVAQVGKKKERLAAVKKFIIGSEVVSVRFFPLALCLGTRLGFEILDIDSSQVDSVFDETDPNLAGVKTTKSIDIFQSQKGELFGCFNHYGVFVDGSGRRSRDYCIEWTITPKSFVMRAPYIIAFGTNCVEVRHMDTAALVQLMCYPALRHLSPHEGNTPDTPIYLMITKTDSVVPVLAELVVKDANPPRVQWIEENKEKLLSLVRGRLMSAIDTSDNYSKMQLD